MNKEYIQTKGGKPILEDIGSTRLAGRIFEDRGMLIRSVQDNTRRYGEQTRLMHITKLDEEDYIAKCIRTVNSKSNPPYDETLYTFNVYKNFIIIDGSKDFLRFPMKILYQKF